VCKSIVRIHARELSDVHVSLTLTKNPALYWASDSHPDSSQLLEDHWCAAEPPLTPDKLTSTPRPKSIPRSHRVFVSAGSPTAGGLSEQGAKGSFVYEKKRQEAKVPSIASTDVIWRNSSLKLWVEHEV
jgi:hypothetical protein